MRHVFIGSIAFVLLACGDPPDDGPDEDGGIDGGMVTADCTGMSDGTSCGTGRICVAEECVTSECGDGIVDVASEDCEDGNDTAFDGCEADCQFTCDDSSDCDDGIACNGAETCSAEACADPTNGQCCADAPDVSDSTPCALDATTMGVCRAGECVVSGCGNGVIEGDEHCDDGNTTACDGCERDCTFTCEQATCGGNPTTPNTWYLDCDDDGFAALDPDSITQCLRPPADDCGGGWTREPPVLGASDCDDSRDDIYPTAEEACDGIDNNCTLGTDEGCAGSDCTAPTDCDSGFCVDGVCCNTECTGQCEACNLTRGTCSQVSGAPVGSRASCGGSGSCAGSCGSNRTSCDYPTTVCSPQSCSGTTLTQAASCDASHNCPAAVMTSCAPYICVGSSCGGPGSCGSDAQCAPGYYCNAGNCLSTKPNGRGCSLASECTSNVCADGYCCDRGCSGSCEVCSATPGTCTYVTGAPPAGRAACTGSGTTCGGTCNGSSSGCTYPGSGTSCGYCGATSAFNQAAYNGGQCNGAGSCTGATATSCGAYACFYSPAIGLYRCHTSCTSNAQCGSLYTCSAGTCNF